jgi:radical SAM protein with 4Fe4S-binding SPASM domain
MLSFRLLKQQIMKKLNGKIADCKDCEVGSGKHKFCSGNCDESSVKNKKNIKNNYEKA